MHLLLALNISQVVYISIDVYFTCKLLLPVDREKTTLDNINSSREVYSLHTHSAK